MISVESLALLAAIGYGMAGAVVLTMAAMMVGGTMPTVGSDLILTVGGTLAISLVMAVCAYVCGSYWLDCRDRRLGVGV